MKSLEVSSEILLLESSPNVTQATTKVKMPLK